ncbi:MAG: hypothetical protein OXH96_10490 [Spirochaetaceae bacterium]|nr:hypothetical protein [Spirochaetaceae bacterium]
MRPATDSQPPTLDDYEQRISDYLGLTDEQVGLISRRLSSDSRARFDTAAVDLGYATNKAIRRCRRAYKLDAKLATCLQLTEHEKADIESYRRSERTGNFGEIAVQLGIVPQFKIDQCLRRFSLFRLRQINPAWVAVGLQIVILIIQILFPSIYLNEVTIDPESGATDQAAYLSVETLPGKAIEESDYTLEDKNEISDINHHWLLGVTYNGQSEVASGCLTGNIEYLGGLQKPLSQKLSLHPDHPKTAYGLTATTNSPICLARLAFYRDCSSAVPDPVEIAYDCKEQL